MTTLRAYQDEAVEATVAALRDGGRGQCITACGTGKTLIAAHVAARLLPASGIAVVACPSLALVAQVLRMWAADGPAHAPLAVCGDDSVADSLVHLADLPCPVTTDPDAVVAWLARTPGRRLLVTTHLSADVAGTALTRADRPADLLIVDEAHHSAGRAGKHIALIHDNSRFPARRRLYMTATPRFEASGVDRPTEQLVVMDNPEVFGPVLYRYPFSRAISEGWLDDYQVAVIGVTKPEVLAILRSLDEAAVTGTHQPPLRTAVVQAALARAAREFDLQRILVFTPRVALAQEFAATLPATLAVIDEAQKPKRSLTKGAVHGRMTVAQRQIHLRHLAHPPDGGWTVIANARCLSEGVDVPAVDGVVFTHPKRSTVDIIQAVGRAMRRNPAGSGVSTILVPILLPDSIDGTDVAGVDDRGEYATLWQVIRALRAHDDILAAELDAQRHRTSDGSAELPARVLVRLPDGYDADQYLRHLTIRLIEATTSPWLDGLAAARAFHAEYGHLRMLANHVTAGGYPLGNWITKQRTAYGRGWLPTDRVAALEALGMIWGEHELRWQEAMQRLADFRAEHGHLRVPQRYRSPDGFRLGSWVSNQRTRHKAGVLPAARRAELEASGMVWEDNDWERGLAAARAFHAEHGHLRIPKGLRVNGIDMSEWIQTRRRDRRRGTLAAERVAILTDLGLVWEPFAEHWKRGLAAARTFHAEHGHLTVPPDTKVHNIDLATWVDNRRADHHAGRLTPDRIAALEELGIDWSPHDADWQRGLAAARAFHAEHGHLRPPANHWCQGVQLSAWVNRRRKDNREGRLPADRKEALDELGMEWIVRKGARSITRS